MLTYFLTKYRYQYHDISSTSYWSLSFFLFWVTVGTEAAVISHSQPRGTAHCIKSPVCAIMDPWCATLPWGHGGFVLRVLFCLFIVSSVSHGCYKSYKATMPPKFCPPIQTGHSVVGASHSMPASTNPHQDLELNLDRRESSQFISPAGTVVC